MKNLTTELRAEIVAMSAEGLKAGKIAQQLKIKKVIIESVLAEETSALNIAVAHEQELANDAALEVVVLDAVAPIVVVEDKSSKLAAMMAAAQAKPADVPAKEANNATHTRGGNMKFATSSSKNEDGTNKQRRNTNVTTRKIAVFMSDSRKEAFISTNLAFTTKTYDGAIKHIKQASQKALQPMLLEADFRMELRDQLVNIGAELNDAKGELHDLLQQEGWSVVGSRPKTTFEVGSRLPVVATNEAPAEEVATDVVVEEATA